MKISPNFCNSVNSETNCTFKFPTKSIVFFLLSVVSVVKNIQFQAPLAQKFIVFAQWAPLTYFLSILRTKRARSQLSLVVGRHFEANPCRFQRTQ
jgi:hypothetical protein